MLLDFLFRMYPLNMLNDINMEFIQALNPLYAVPIIAVILCAFIVYAFGFKSPVPPPSFEGIEEEKRYPKKRRVKDNQKKEKLLQNGSATTKSGTTATKKKEATEKHVAAEKNNAEAKKSPVTEKKANKKSRMQNERKSAQEKKKESFSHDDFNEDGWVQHVSKKGRPKKGPTEIIYVPSILSRTIDTNKSDNSQVGDSPKKNDELSKENSKVDVSPKRIVELSKDITEMDQKLQTSAAKKENSSTKAVPVEKVTVEKIKIQNVVVEDAKPDNDNLEKQRPKEMAANSPKMLEESNKPKKKKKKNVELVQSEKDSISKPKNVSDSSAVQVISEIPASQEICKSVIVEDLPAINKVEKDQPSDIKTTNVVFDELAGLYPETKEPKKKKKVRRDH